MQASQAGPGQLEIRPGLCAGPGAGVLRHGRFAPPGVRLSLRRWHVVPHTAGQWSAAACLGDHHLLQAEGEEGFGFEGYV